MPRHETRFSRTACRFSVALTLLGFAALASLPVSAHSEKTGNSREPAAATVVFTKPANTLSINPGVKPAARLPLLGDPYVTSGFIKKELPTTATGAPYVSSGYMKVEMDAKGKATPVPAPKAPPLTKPQANLVKRIEQTCGRMARNVEVQSESATVLQVSFTVAELGEAERVSRQVMQIPELLPYQVTFAVHVAP
jgi:hypothetical protein